MASKAVAFWCTFLGGVALDQATKAWVVLGLAPRTDEVVVVPGLLSLIHAQNPGASFGLLSDFEWRYWIFAAATIVISAILFDMFRRLPRSQTLVAASIGLILSGVVGNAIDRVHKGTVTDFVKVYVDAEPARAWLLRTFGTNQWPAFNVADAALVVGVGLFLLHATFGDEEDPADPEAEQDAAG